VIYKINKEFGKLKPFSQGTVDAYVKIQFIGLAFSILGTYERTLIFLKITLYSVFKRNVNYITAGLIIDFGVTIKDYKTFTTLIIIKIKVLIKRLVDCFFVISNKLIYEFIIEIPFMVGIKYTL